MQRTDSAKHALRRKHESDKRRHPHLGATRSWNGSPHLHSSFIEVHNALSALVSLHCCTGRNLGRFRNDHYSCYNKNLDVSTYTTKRWWYPVHLGVVCLYGCGSRKDRYIISVRRPCWGGRYGRHATPYVSHIRNTRRSAPWSIVQLLTRRLNRSCWYVS